MTWGELDDLIADLARVWTEADLPSGLAVPLVGSRGAGQHPFRRAALTCALVLAIGLLAGVATTALRAGCLLVLAVLLLPLVPGCGQRATRSARSKLPPRHRDPR